MSLSAPYVYVIGSCRLEANSVDGEAQLVLGGTGFRLASFLSHRHAPCVMSTTFSGSPIGDMFRSVLLERQVRLHIKKARFHELELSVRVDNQQSGPKKPIDLEQDFINRVIKNASVVMIDDTLSPSTLKHVSKEVPLIAIVSQPHFLNSLVHYSARLVILTNPVLNNAVETLCQQDSSVLYLNNHHFALRVGGQPEQIFSIPSALHIPSNQKLEFLATFIAQELMVDAEAPLFTAVASALTCLTDFIKTNDVIAPLADFEDYLSHLLVKAQTDPLTGVLNRDGVLSWLANESNEDGDISTILLDIDHFKKVNDTYGHKAGDIALIDVAQILLECTRAQDVVARWGGEEFICFVKAPQRIAMQMAERMRQKVEVHDFCKIPIGITLSGGVACRRPYEEIDILIERADTALYAAKHASRNLICAG